jgi:ABC-type transporter Mla maintaining outer membrane lipid asymmetry permease subunit MlaE
MTPGTWLVVWDIVIGIWAAWFVALVVIGITQSVWQSRDRWRSQVRYWWRSRI